MVLQSNRSWLPAYCQPGTFLPAVQSPAMLFSGPPYLFQDFMALAIAFLQSDSVRKTGLSLDPQRTLPCKWKCADEALFGVDLGLYAYTGHYPFNKGRIGGGFDETSLVAAAHHGQTNLDIGGSHVGYLPGPGGGRFGYIERPLHPESLSTDCGYLMALLAPFKEVYDDACQNILLYCPVGEQVIISVPNEFLQPSWSSQRIKLLLDLETLTAGEMPHQAVKVHTHQLAGRSLFHASQPFLAGLSEENAAAFRRPEPSPIGRELGAEYFAIFDSGVQLQPDGSPIPRLLPYVKYMLASRSAPYPLEAAVINTIIEYNNLTDSVRGKELRHCSFVSFTGVFIDLHDAELGSYVNLFQPVGISIKAAGQPREVELAPEEIREIFDRLKPARPVRPLPAMLDRKAARRLIERFTFRPGHFTE